MGLAPLSARRLSALLLGFGAVYFAVHLWFVLSASFNVQGPDRVAFLDMAGESIAYWSLFCLSGVVLGYFAVRYAALGLLARCAVLLSSAGVGLAVALLAEWWASTYFLVPALFLALAHRQLAHA